MRCRADLPDALAALDALGARAAGRELHVFLDFDGTLTPIVERPEDAVFDPAMRRRLRRLAERHGVAIVSGRAMDDLLERVAVDGIYYAGSHGFELRRPDGRMEEQAQAHGAAARLGLLADHLAAALAGVAGVQLERKRFGLAVHYRRVADTAVPAVQAAVRAAAAAFPELTVKAGKKVLEFVPDLDWHKGEALGWILAATGRSREQTLPLYLGDDVTDEDAFRAIDGWGIGIAVGPDGPQTTAAHYGLPDIAAVGRFLDQVADQL